MLNISLAYYDNATQELCWLFATSSIVRNLNKLYSMMSGFMHLMHNFCSCCLQFQPSQAVHLFFNVHRLQFSWQLYAFSVWFLAAKWALLQNKLQISNFLTSQLGSKILFGEHFISPITFKSAMLAPSKWSWLSGFHLFITTPLPSTGTSCLPSHKCNVALICNNCAVIIT